MQGTNMFLKIRKRGPGAICDCSRTPHCVCSLTDTRRQFDIYAERDGKLSSDEIKNIKQHQQQQQQIIHILFSYYLTFL
jgi:hypothetical protein